MTVPDRLTRAVQAALSDDLRRPPWRGDPNPFAGHCYVACEALWHLLGGMESDWRPQFLHHEGQPHWFLRDRETQEILDPTASQFTTPVPYAEANGKGFLTRKPSKRAQCLIQRSGYSPTSSNRGASSAGRRGT